jgi:phenylpropionate dioxygenase-like ring-hydroxylating dioxygenase large terminal subunit
MTRPTLVDEPGLARDFALEDRDVKLDTARYTSKEFLAEELERLWMRVWQPACRVDDLPENGSWREYRVGSKSFVVVRGSDGVIRAFRNSCLHRGLLLCEGQGRSNSLRCPYHGWSWHLDGALARVQDREFFNEIDDSAYTLPEIGCGTWAGFVLINPTPEDSPSLEEYLQPLSKHLDQYELDQYVPAGINVEAPVACNWKTWQDAFVETYHLPFLHAQGLLFSNELGTRFSLLGEHSLMITPFAEASGRARGITQRQVVEAYLGQLPVTSRKLMQSTTSATDPSDQSGNGLDADQLLHEYGADLEWGSDDEPTARAVIAQLLRRATDLTGFDTSPFDDNQVTDVWQYLMFPNLLLACHPGHVFVTWVGPDPIDPNRCFVRVVNLRWTRPDERDAIREPLRTLTEDELNGAELVRLGRAVEQDVHNVRRQQLGLQLGGLAQQTLSRHEIRIVHLHRVIDSYLAR